MQCSVCDRAFADAKGLRAHRKTNVQHLALVTWFGSPGRRKNIKEASESVREQLLQLVRADRGRSVRVYMGLLAESTQRGMAGRTSWPTLPEFLSALEAAGQVLIARAGDTHWEWTLRPGEGVTARAQARTQWESDDGGAVLSSSVRESSSVVQDRSASSVEDAESDWGGANVARSSKKRKKPLPYSTSSFASSSSSSPAERKSKHVSVQEKVTGLTARATSGGGNGRITLLNPGFTCAEDEAMDSDSSINCKRVRLDEAPEAIAKYYVDNEKRDPKWLLTGLIVRVRNKTLLGGRYHSFKAHVLELESDFVAKLQILHGHSCALLKAHQSELETVVPPIGHPLRIVNTKECGEWGIVNAVDEECMMVSVEMQSGVNHGRIRQFRFSDVCRTAQR